MNEPSVLIVEDELAVVQQFSRMVERFGCAVEAALTAAEAAAKIKGGRFAVVFYDLKLSLGGGREFLLSLRRESPATAVVILHGLAPMVAAQTLNDRNYHFLAKPFSAEELFDALSRALRLHQILSTEPRPMAAAQEEFSELIGHSPAMQTLFGLLSRVAHTGDTVLLSGKTGTGKIFAARAIHRISPRRNEPFIWFESSKIDPAEINHRLFGFTSNNDLKSSRPTSAVEEAAGGTLYIDEITVLDRQCQTALLEIIRTHGYSSALGAPRREISCRFIWGTERDLREFALSGYALEELYNGIKVFPLYLPTLAERIEDIPALVQHFITRTAQRLGKSVTRIDDRLLTILIARPWPGNVRELAQCIERMTSICHGNTLTVDHYIQIMEQAGGLRWWGRTPVNSAELKAVKRHLRRAAITDLERSFILDALQRSGGKVSRAAKDVGMQRRNFQTLMKNCGVKGG